METQIAEFNEFEAKMAEFKKDYDDVVYNLDDPVQDKKARSDKYTIGKVISALDTKHKELKAPLKAQVDLIDGERKRIKDELLEVQGKIKSQIDAHEDAIHEHAEMLQGKVDALIQLGQFGEFETPIADQILGRIEKLEETEIDDSYEIRKADATLAKVDALKVLNARYEKQKKYEFDQAELQRLIKEKEERDRLEREEAIRKEAAENAKREAEEKAERIRNEAETKAKQAEAAAKAEADRKVKEAEERGRQAVIEERAKQEAEAKKKREMEAAEAKKKEKQAHRAKIHKAAKESFIKQGIGNSEATLIVELIRDGKIAHVVIEY